MHRPPPCSRATWRVRLAGSIAAPPKVCGLRACTARTCSGATWTLGQHVAQPPPGLHVALILAPAVPPTRGPGLHRSRRSAPCSRCCRCHSRGRVSSLAASPNPTTPCRLTAPPVAAAVFAGAFPVCRSSQHPGRHCRAAAAAVITGWGAAAAAASIHAAAAPAAARGRAPAGLAFRGPAVQERGARHRHRGRRRCRRRGAACSAP